MPKYRIFVENRIQIQRFNQKAGVYTIHLGEAIQIFHAVEDLSRCGNLPGLYGGA